MLKYFKTSKVNARKGALVVSKTEINTKFRKLKTNTTAAEFWKRYDAQNEHKFWKDYDKLLRKARKNKREISNYK